MHSIIECIRIITLLKNCIKTYNPQNYPQNSKIFVDSMWTIFLHMKVFFSLSYHSVILVIHFLNGVFQQIIMHTVRNQQNKQHDDERNQNNCFSTYKRKHAHYRANRNQTEHYKMNQSLMRKERNLIQMLLNLMLPVDILLILDLTIQKLIYIFKIRCYSFLHYNSIPLYNCILMY